MKNKTTKPIDVRSLIPENLRVSMTEKTVSVWKSIFDYIKANQYADMIDIDFVEAMQEKFRLSKPTIARHLLRMNRSGILDSYSCRRKPGQAGPYTTFLFGVPPTSFVRYVIKGSTCVGKMFREDAGGLM